MHSSVPVLREVVEQSCLLVACYASQTACGVGDIRIAGVAVYTYKPQRCGLGFIRRRCRDAADGVS